MNATLPPRLKVPDRAPTLTEMMRLAPSDPVLILPWELYEKGSYTLPGGRGSPIAFTDLAAVETVLSDSGETFGRNRVLRRLMRRAWNNGLAAAEGEDWLRQRRAVAPALRPQAMPGYMPAIEGAVARAADRLPGSAALDLMPETGRVASEAVLTTLLTGAEGADYAALAADIPVFMRRITDFGLADLLPLPESMIDAARGIPSDPARQRLQAFAERLAAARAAPPDAQADIPALMRGQGPMFDNVFGFMIASFETTAIAAAWSLYLLALYPDWQARVQAEAETASRLPAEARLAALGLTRQVVREAMRLYPPAPMIVRTCLKRTQIAGERLFAGQTVMIPIYVIHRHTKLWQAPDAFDPARFEATGADRPRLAFMPFGAGPRMCAAAVFAEAELCMLVSGFVARRQFATAGPAPVVSTRTVTASDTGLWVTATPV